MEIERKYLIEKEQLPKNLSDYPFHRIEQGYLFPGRTYPQTG